MFELPFHYSINTVVGTESQWTAPFGKSSTNLAIDPATFRRLRAAVPGVDGADRRCAVHTGLQLDHKSGGAIELINAAGKKIHIDGDHVEAYQVLPQSLMPNGLVDTMTVSDVRNLMAYIESL